MYAENCSGVELTALNPLIGSAARSPRRRMPAEPDPSNTSVPFPFAPAAQQREIQSEPHGRIHRLIALELLRVPHDFLVEERIDVRAFMAARLVIDRPALAVAGAEMPIEDIRANALRRAHAQAVFGARLGMRAQRPRAALVGEGVLEGGAHQLGGRIGIV